MSDNPVHNLKPGALGLVAHTMKPHELNGWVKRVVVDSTQYYPSDLMFGGNLYKLDLHIPHGTLVLVLSENQLRTASSNIYSRYYQVLWGETALFIRGDRVFNPYFNGEESP